MQISKTLTCEAFVFKLFVSSFVSHSVLFMASMVLLRLDFHHLIFFVSAFIAYDHRSKQLLRVLLLFPMAQNQINFNRSDNANKPKINFIDSALAYIVQLSRSGST